MNAVPANSGMLFISPLALRLSQFLALKHAMGYRYREKRAAHCRSWIVFLTLDFPQTIPSSPRRLCTITWLEGEPNRRLRVRID
jgi:hypothetical protein